MLLKAGIRTRAIYANQFAIRQYSQQSAYDILKEAEGQGEIEYVLKHYNLEETGWLEQYESQPEFQTIKIFKKYHPSLYLFVMK